MCVCVCVCVCVCLCQFIHTNSYIYIFFQRHAHKKTYVYEKTSMLIISERQYPIVYKKKATLFTVKLQCLRANKADMF